MYKIESQYTGNPIEIKDKKGIEIEKIIVEGKTVQEKTEGYNLLDETLINKSDSTYWVTDKVKGIDVEANKDYYFTTYTSMSVIRALELGTDKVIKEVTDTTELTFNVENATKVYFTVYKTENVPTNTKILFTEGKEQKPYEPYTGGPTPRPDYPQEIKNVKGYRNLLDETLINKSDNTYWVTDKINGINVEANKDYYFTTYTSMSVLRVLELGTDKVIKEVTDTIELTFNVENATKVYFTIYKAESIPTNTKILFTEGNEKRPYVPYGSNYLELNAYLEDNSNSTLVNLQNNEICEGDTLIVQNGYASIDKNKAVYEITGEETTWLENTATRGLFQITLENVSVDLTRVHAISTHFIGNKGTDIAKPTDYIDNSISTYSGNRLFFRINSYANNLNGFKQFLKDQKANGTPVIVQYELATNENIELPIVNDLIAYDNYTNIEVVDNLKPNMTINIKYNLPQSIIDSIKKGKPVKAYLEVQPKNPNEEPIIISEDNYLSTFDLEQFRYIPDEGFIGGCVYNKLVVNFINVDNTFNLENRELKLYIGLYDSEKEDYTYIFYGTYIVQKPGNENTTDNSKIECADYMIKFNQPYIDRVTYPTTIKTLLLDICEQLDIKLGTTSFANENFVIENNQFVGGESYREVLKAIAMSAFSWARIKQDVLYLDFEVKNDEDIVETITNDYYYQDKLKLQDTMYGPVNRVVMGMTDIDGESEFVEDKDLQIYPLNKNICPSQFDYWESGEYNTSGDIVDNTKRIRIKQLLPIKNNSLLYLDCFSDTIQFVVRTYNKNKEFIRNIGAVSNKNTIQLNENEYYLGLILYNYNNESSMTYEKYQEMFANNEIKPFICLNSEENKEFEVFETNGVCEIVLNDNPFAYTEEKRRELVQAGTKLFGLKYFPLETETVGFIYLDSGDFASIVDMQGIPRNTLILDYTIKYTGAITDKISSPAKTNSQTKYLYTPQLEQIIRKTEYRVDRAEQTITSTVQTIDGVVTETNEIKQQVDKITQRYEKTGGNNKIRDSVGLYSHSSDEYWINSETGDFEQGYSQDLVGRTESASQISIRNGTKTTTKNNIVNLMTNKEITLTYKLTNDENTTTTIRLYGNNLLYENIITEKTELKEYSITFIPDRSDLILEITSKTTQQGWTRISDLMLGDSKLWELAQNETWSRVIETNPFGQLIKAENVDTGLFLGIEGLGIYELNNGQTLGNKKGSLTKDGLETDKVICNDIVQNKLIKTNIDINGNDIYIEYIRSDIQ